MYLKAFLVLKTPSIDRKDTMAKQTYSMPVWFLSISRYSNLFSSIFWWWKAFFMLIYACLALRRYSSIWSNLPFELTDMSSKDSIFTPSSLLSSVLVFFLDIIVVISFVFLLKKLPSFVTDEIVSYFSNTRSSWSHLIISSANLLILFTFSKFL